MMAIRFRRRMGSRRPGLSARARLLTVGVALAAAGGASAIAAQPAQAAVGHCTRYLIDTGYNITWERREACVTGASGIAGAWLFCHNQLIDTGVLSFAAGEACDRADGYWRQGPAPADAAGAQPR